MPTCERCGTSPEGEERFCGRCGADLRPDEPKVRSAELFEAAAREQEWLGGNPMSPSLEPGENVVREPALGPIRFEDYRDPRGRELLARGLIVATFGLAVVSAFFELIHMGILSDIRDGTFTDLAVWKASKARLDFAYIATFVAYLLAAIPFIWWLVRARRNVEALGVNDLRFSRGWAIGSWFTPILSLWRPPQVVAEIWQASDPDLPERAYSESWSLIPLTWVVPAWWLAFIGGGILDRIAGRMDGRATTPDAAIAAHRLSLVASLLTAVAALLVLQVMRQITRRQRARSERIRAVQLAAGGEEAGADAASVAAPEPAM